jgi:hypothetical protein
MVFAVVVPGCYGAAREERLANWSAGGRVPEVSEAIFTARATGAALQRMLGASVGRAQQAGADVQNAGRALGVRTGVPALA